MPGGPNLSRDGAASVQLGLSEAFVFMEGTAVFCCPYDGQRSLSSVIEEREGSVLRERGEIWHEGCPVVFDLQIIKGVQ